MDCNRRMGQEVMLALGEIGDEPDFKSPCERHTLCAWRRRPQQCDIPLRRAQALVVYREGER